MSLNDFKQQITFTQTTPKEKRKLTKVKLQSKTNISFSFLQHILPLFFFHSYDTLNKKHF